MNPRTRPTAPRLRVLSLGAGVQSTTLLLLSAHGAIQHYDAAIFTDTGWEPAAVYRHLKRLEGIAADAGIPLIRVAAGNIRDDALDRERRFASMPLFLHTDTGNRGMLRRQCTAEYKIRPIKREIRRLLGHPHPDPVPAGVYAEQSIGISADEVHRAKDADVGYLHNAFPLLDIGWARRDCRAYLAAHGLADTPKSACIGCPYRSNSSWAEMRATEPAAWEDAVDFDAAVRRAHATATRPGMPLAGRAYLHRDRIPLDQVDLGIDTGPDPDGCSPWACRSEPRRGTGNR